MQEMTHLWQVIVSIWEQLTDWDKTVIWGVWLPVWMQIFDVLPTFLACLATASVFVLNAIRIKKELKESKAEDDDEAL